MPGAEAPITIAVCMGSTLPAFHVLSKNKAKIRFRPFRGRERGEYLRDGSGTDTFVGACGVVKEEATDVTHVDSSF